MKGQRLKRPDLVSITTDGIRVSQHLIEDISIAGFLDTIGDQHQATTTCVCGGCSGIFERFVNMLLTGRDEENPFLSSH